MGRINNKAQFLTIDALIALTIIIITITIVVPVLKQPETESSVSADILQSLSTLKIGEMLDASALAAWNITDPGKPVIDQIGEFYITNISIARNLSGQILSSISTTENIGIWYGNQLLASRNITPIETAKNVFIDRQVISGIGGNGTGVTGFSARAFLSSSGRTEYFYFGGYVGEGNITNIIEYQGNITSAEMELAISKDFDVYINGAFSQSFTGTGDDFTPSNYSLDTSNFISGSNTLEIKGDNLHITGGFIKIIYDSEVTYEQPERYYFPGIEGIINLYDGFYIPGNLTGLTISLHFNNSINTFLSLGDTQVFNASSDGTVISITNATLSALLDYTELSKKTIPLRFGMEGVEYTANQSRDIEVFSVTSISGQMQGGNKMDLLRQGNYDFVEIMLNETNNSVGLAAYENSVKDEDFHPLSNNPTSLNNTIEGWKAGGSTCTCCGINKAVDELVASPNPEKFKSIVIMSAGSSNKKCLEQNTGDSEQDAIKAACDAYSNYGIRIYTIGFGDTPNIQTLTDMASCGDGSYYSTVDDLATIYEKIAEELIETAYFEQTVEVSGSFFSQLFPDSYIEFDYIKETPPVGLVITLEEKFTTTSGVNFSLPANSTPLEANVISYSGPRWTSLLNINTTNIYNLSSYQEDYLKLGDPYSVNIPASLIQDNNSLYLETGLSPVETFPGSINNTVIYTVSKEMASYTSVSATADGCNWNVQLLTHIMNMAIPADYSGSAVCNYTTTEKLCDIYSECEGATDAIQIAVYNIFKSLDFNSDGKIDIELSEDNIKISTSNLEGVPFHFSTEVQVRKWY